MANICAFNSVHFIDNISRKYSILTELATRTAKCLKFTALYSVNMACVEPPLN